MSTPQWWAILVWAAGREIFIGRTFATAAQVQDAVGPYHRIEGNAIYVFAPPPKKKEGVS